MNVKRNFPDFQCLAFRRLCKRIYRIRILLAKRIHIDGGEAGFIVCFDLTAYRRFDKLTNTLVSKP